MISNQLNSFFQALNHLCEPNPKYIKDKDQYEIARRRNKAILGFELINIIMHCFNLIGNKFPIANSLFGILGGVFVMFILLVSCRSHPELFKVFYNIIVAFYGPSLVYQNDLGVHTAWAGVHTFPLFVLLVTGSLWHFLLQAGLQLFLLNTVYQSAMIKTVDYMTSESFIGSLAHASNLLLGLSTISILWMQISLQNAYKKIAMVEKKKQEIERQRTFLLGLSHELRNLINSLMGNIKLATLENLPEKAKEFLYNADLCGELLLHMINNLLDSGKVEVGDLEINPNPVNIYDVLGAY